MIVKSIQDVTKISTQLDGIAAKGTAYRCGNMALREVIRDAKQSVGLYAIVESLKHLPSIVAANKKLIQEQKPISEDLINICFLITEFCGKELGPNGNIREAALISQDGGKKVKITTRVSERAVIIDAYNMIADGWANFGTLTTKYVQPDSGVLGHLESIILESVNPVSLEAKVDSINEALRSIPKIVWGASGIVKS